MGETSLRDNRQLPIFISVGLVFVIIITVLAVRSCAPKDPNAGYTVVYSNLDLKDAANVVTQLKALKIPYQIRDKGRSIAVPKGKADEARLGLAEKSIPSGGVVGWEIFDQSKLGTTDFDRRVQFVRAISGELARTISRVDAVEDARIQIVIPKTELFEVTKAPVTASVLLQLKPGRVLSQEQISGIVHLVAGSVENLRPENVIIVDIYGNILSGPKTAVTERPAEMRTTPMEIYLPRTTEAVAPFEAPSQEAQPMSQASEVVPVITKEVASVPVVPKAVPFVKPAEMETLKQKEAYENELSSKVQTLVNNFYPPNSILIKVNVEYGSAAKNLPAAKPSAKKPKAAKQLPAKISAVPKPSQVKAAPVKRLTVIVLVDNRFNLTAALKKTTFETIAGALPYNRKRGDRIILRKVPFHYATEFSQGTIDPKAFSSDRDPLLSAIKTFSRYRQPLTWAGGGVVLLFVLFVLSRLIAGRKKKAVEIKRGEDRRQTAGGGAIEQMKDMVGQSPDRVAELLKKWLSEEKEK